MQSHYQIFKYVRVDGFESQLLSGVGLGWNSLPGNPKNSLFA